MKNNIKTIIKGGLLLFICFFVVIACSDDDNNSVGDFNLATIETSLEEAQNILTSTEEGANAGDQKPGSKATLESVISAIERLIAGAGSQEDISDAQVKLSAAIQTYKESIVATRIPYVKQGEGSLISISENIKPTLAGPFTIQGQFYIVDLNAREFSSNLFACNQPNPDSGFTVRYFSDGTVNLLTGDGSWGEVNTAPDVFKKGEWFNVAYTNTGSKQTLFVEGEEIISLDKNYLLSADATLAIGNSPSFTNRSANLLARKFTVWNKVLDQVTIQANATADFDGSEDGLEAYFPLGSDLGLSFVDVTEKYTASFEGSVEWVIMPPVIEIDYTNIDAAITAMEEFKASVTEGNQNGDYPIGTIDYIDGLLSAAADLRANETRQDSLNEAANNLNADINLINDNLVADARGFFIDGDDPNAVGFRVTPNYTPQGDYTYEFDLRLRDLLYDNGDASGDVFGNGTIGFRVQGYQELTEENILNSGGGWNFTDTGSGFIGPRFPPLTLRSDQWFHIAIVHNNTERTTKVYVDGEVVGESMDIGAPVVSGWGEIWLGRGFLKMDGYLADFRLWDVALTPSEFEADITGNESGLQVYFPMDKVKGIRFSDQTGNYQGELRGVVWNKE